MIDKNLLNSLSAKDKESFQTGLSSLIEQTYVIEKEYKALNESYTSLQDFIKQIVETLPNALWVIDENNKMFLQNSEAKRINHILEHINFEQNYKEMEIDNEFYLIKMVKNSGKTIISATEITDEKRKERLASMGQVAAHLAHEIRNPIGSVSLLTSTLFKRVDLKNKALVLEMQKSIWRVERIIKATLLFSKGIQLNSREFYIDELEESSKDSISHYTYSKKIDFYFDLPHKKIFGDKDLLSMVLQNLLFNAIDAIEEDEDETGEIKLSFEEDEKYYFLDIMDNGVEVEDKNLLFEPFKSTKLKGNGLGLALCIQIANAHEGDIVLLENPKKFRVKLKKYEMA